MYRYVLSFAVLVTLSNASALMTTTKEPTDYTSSTASSGSPKPIITSRRKFSISAPPLSAPPTPPEPLLTTANAADGKITMARLMAPIHSLGSPDTHTGYLKDDSLAGSQIRGRGTSISPLGQRTTVGVSNDDDAERSSSKKRSNADSIDYPRRRAPIAVRLSRRHHRT